MAKTLKELKAEPNSLYRNINIAKKEGKSKSKSKSTVDQKQYDKMKKGFKK